MSFQLDDFLPYQLAVAASLVSRQFAARYADEAGLTVPEWRVLAHLNHSGTVSVRDIHSRVNLDKSMISRAASRLQEAGLVRKSGHDTDRRLIVLELTEEGQRLMQRLGRIAEDFQAELLAEIGEDAPALKRAVARIAERATE